MRNWVGWYLANVVGCEGANVWVSHGHRTLRVSIVRGAG